MRFRLYMFFQKSSSTTTTTQPKRSSFRTLLLFTLTFVVSLAANSQIIVHQLSSWDDGDPTKDADGVRNHVVVWQAGPIHVVDYRYSVSGWQDTAIYTLKIMPGAIVKFAGDIQLDQNGNLISWMPTYDAGMISEGFAGGGNIEMEGAIITDIRDDAVGGDTNEDGAATQPSQSYFIRFSGRTSEICRNNTIRYAGLVGHFGSIEVSGNTFVKCGGIGSISSSLGFNTSPVVLDATTIFSNNVIELETPSYGGGTLDVRGMSAVITKNTFRGNAARAIWLGPAREVYWSSKLGPQTGITVVSDNVIETRDGVSLSAPGSDQDSLFGKINFRAEIRNNTLRGTGNGIGIEVAYRAQTTVTGNTVSNYAWPLRIYFSNYIVQPGNQVPSPLKINGNSFSLEGASGGPGGISSLFWSQGFFVNAKNNFWGDGSGPRDNSNADGLHNPRGNGLVIGDGIDYVPFVGGTTAPIRDRIQITASSTPAAPFTPESNLTLNVSVSNYNLESTPTGKIVVLVRDADGSILNQPGTSVNVTSQNHSASIPPIPILVPKSSTTITVEAALAPDGDESLTIYSNSIPFKVNIPAPSFRLIGVTQPGLPFPPIPLRGKMLSAIVEFEYTYVQSSVTIEIDIEERAAKTGEIIETYPQQTFTVPAGTNLRSTRQIDVNLPLRNVLLYDLANPHGELHGKFTAKDAGGNVIATFRSSVPIVESGNNIRPIQIVCGLDRQYLNVGEMPRIAYGYEYRVATPNVTNWEIWAGHDQALDANGNVLHQYTPAGPAITGVATGSSNGLKISITQATVPIPAGTKKYRAFLRMVAPSLGFPVAVAWKDFEVREAERTAQLTIPTGASQNNFTPLPVQLGFTSNQTSSAAIVDEFSTYAAANSQRTISSLASRIWNLIPINRYWSIVDTLKEGTFSGQLTITYNPATDFPSTPGFLEDSLVIAGLNYLSGQPEPLPTTLNKTNHTVTTTYTRFYDTYYVASRSTTITDVGEGKIVPERFVLSQNYPNPFNPETEVRYQITEVSMVSLKVYDMLGREVAILTDEVKTPGEYSATWNAANLSSGIYYYRLVVNPRGSTGSRSFVETKKMILLR